MHGQGSFVHICIKSPADEQVCHQFCVTARLQLQYSSCLHILDPICVIGKFQGDETNVLALRQTALVKHRFASIEVLTRTAGIVDNIYGANFNVNPPSADVLDQHGHGTFVAGVIGAVGNNAVGITGVNQVRLLRLHALILCPSP